MPLFAKGREDMVGSERLSSLDYMAWARRRLEALDKMEVKLREMRELAVYAAGRTLAPEETAQVQEWMNTLHREVVALDQETLWTGGAVLAH